MSSKNLWNDDSIQILLTEYKKLKDAFSILRSSSMPKKGWELIKRKLHAAGYRDIRNQHVIKKFAGLKLHYKEFREGLPVKQRVYGFVDQLAEILDDDPYIAFAKPTKRMKEKRLYENKRAEPAEKAESYILLELSEVDTGQRVTQLKRMDEVEHIEEGQYIIDPNVLLVDNNGVEDKSSSKKLKKTSGKSKTEQTAKDDNLGMPQWITYLVDLLRKEEKQKSDHLWRLHNDICQAEKVKLDMLERVISTYSHSSKSGDPPKRSKTKTDPKTAEMKDDSPRNIIIVDEEGAIFLKPSDDKKKGRPIEYKILGEHGEMEFVDEGAVVDDSQRVELHVIGEDGEEIILEPCDSTAVYQMMEPAYQEEVVDDNQVISHQVEIVEEQVETDIVHHNIEHMEFIQTVPP